MLDVTMQERAQAPDQSLRRLGGRAAAQVMEDPADQGDQDDGRPRQHEVGEEGVLPVTRELREHWNAGGQRALEGHVDRVLGDERDEQRQRARHAKRSDSDDEESTIALGEGPEIRLQGTRHDHVR